MSGYWSVRAVVGGAVRDRVRVTHDAGIITAVEVGVDAEAGDTVLGGLTVPGLADAHSHAFHRALRGRTHGDGGSFWTWREQMYHLAGVLDPDTYLELATAVFVEMVGAGITVVGEFHYLHHDVDGSPYAEPGAMSEALAEAASRAGVRLTLLDTLYLAGGLDATGSAVPLSPVQRRFSDGDVESWLTRRARLAETDLLRVGAAVHSVRAVSPGDLDLVRAAALDGPLHVHVSEQPAENSACRAAHGVTPVRLLADHGLLTPSTTAVHATHLDGADVVALAASGAGVCVCPTTERDLADGIGPARVLHDAGVPLSLGTDQNATVDLLEEMRGLEMDERLASGRRGRFTPAELLTAGTSAGYAALGWDGGRLEVGALCDLTSIDERSVRTAGSSPDQLWLAASAPDVLDTVVGGRHV
ncbi:MAG: formimidoylglutamate deiminase, partial [Cellulomonadaceae bacterium]|nr:formimidoylglutamate deiminase [Cellulomonadaceae bacterium]